MTPAALIFDVDGTLAETEEVHREAFNRAFEEWRLEWRWDRGLYRELLLVTGGKERLCHYIETRRPAGAERFAGYDEIVRLHARKTALYGELVRSGGVNLRPGVERLLNEARAAGWRLAIATTTNMEPLEALFAGTLGEEAWSWFDAIAVGDMAKNKKPAPDLFEIALKKLDMAPEACLAIEDSTQGLKSARAAGLQVVITQSAYTHGHDFTGALAAISDLGEPGAPFTPLGGLADEPGIVDLDLLAKWRLLAQRPDFVVPSIKTRK